MFHIRYMAFWLMHHGVVDGGHRAIKYTRIGGVKKEIYNEGKQAYSRMPGLCI